MSFRLSNFSFLTTPRVGLQYYSIVLYTDFNCSSINGVQCVIDGVSAGACSGGTKCEKNCKMAKAIIGALLYSMMGAKWASDYNKAKAAPASKSGRDG